MATSSRSFLRFSTIARRMLRPIRPNPLIATFIAMNASALRSFKSPNAPKLFLFTL